MVVCQIPLHRLHVFVLLLHVPQCSFCKQLPLVPDTNDLDFVSFLLDIYDVLLYCLIVHFHQTFSWSFSGSSMKLSDAVVLAELGHQRILKFPSIVSRVYFLRESKLPASIPIHLLLPYFAMDKAMNISWNDQSCGESSCVCDDMSMDVDGKFLRSIRSTCKFVRDPLAWIGVGRAVFVFWWSTFVLRVLSRLTQRVVLLLGILTLPLCAIFK